MLSLHYNHPTLTGLKQLKWAQLVIKKVRGLNENCVHYLFIMQDIEEWRPVRITDGKYVVSNFGNIGRVIAKTNTIKLLKCHIDLDGYRVVNFSGYKQNNRVARIVAIEFIPNQDNKPCVDHIDTIRTNDLVSNLKWSTYTENANNPLTKLHRVGMQNGEKSVWFGVINGDSPSSYSICQYDLRSNFIKEWDCAMRVERELGYSHQEIGKCVLGKNKSAYGFLWARSDSGHIPIYTPPLKSTACFKPVCIVDSSCGIIKEYESARSASIDGFSYDMISRCCNGKSAHHKGFIWKFKKDIP